MSYDFAPVINFLEKVVEKFRAENPKKGKPYSYSEIGFLLFFMTMFLKRIFTFKGMERYGNIHYAKFGFKAPPSRQTIRRRFHALPDFLVMFIPWVAHEAATLDPRFRSNGIGFVDKCLFWAKGGMWHKKDMKAGNIPNKKIDTQGTWGFTPYRKRWVFGYGLHAVVNKARFPFSAWITTASARDDQQVSKLLKNMVESLLILVGDKGYRVIKMIKDVFNDFKTFVLTNKPYKTLTKKFTRWYSTIISMDETLEIYWKRKPSVEPFFSLVKELFNLTDRNPLPYKGLDKNRSFILTVVFTMQCVMIFNSIYNLNLRSLSTFRAVMI